MKNEERVFYYKDFNDEFVESSNQNFKVPEGYKWIHDSLIYRMISCMVYGLFAIFGYLYCKINLRVKIKNKKILRKYKNSGYYIYGNHTQVIGDVFMPALAVFPKKIYTVVSPANLGIPVIGKILPMLGALPKPKSYAEMKQFSEAIKKRINQKKCIVIYPEAHVWPYYTDIRPYSKNAFKIPVNENKPTFCMTTTYQKRRFSDKPRITVYLDGPFLSDNSITKDKKIEKIYNDVYQCMKNRSDLSTYKYFEYKHM